MNERSEFGKRSRLEKAQRIGHGHVLQWMRTSQRRGPCEMIDLIQIMVYTYSSAVVVSQLHVLSL